MIDFATKGSVVDNINIAKAVVIGFITATLTGVLCLLLLWDNMAFGWIRLIGISLAFLVARIFLLKRNIEVYFNELQM